MTSSPLHQLVPSFILNNLRQDNLQGTLDGAALFIDISGFTRVTEALLQHGQFGAEVLAGIMRAIFTPLVHSVYEQGGFVTGFAGDALTAVFPDGAEQAAPATRALAASVRMQEQMAANARQETRLGIFPFSAKIGLAVGRTHWGILLGSGGRRATYYFRGTPIDASAAAEQHAGAGEIVAAGSFYQHVAAAVSAVPRADYWHITAVSAAPPAPQPIPSPADDTALQARFFSHDLLTQTLEGEFRQVLNVFIGLDGTPTHKALAQLMGDFFRLQEQYQGLLNRIDFGDKGCGLLLFWGAPLSYENDLTRALDFVHALREASATPLRAGITYRIAHAGYIGSPLAEEYTCYGRGVNLAARQMTSAGWGEIWLDEEVARRATGEFHVQALGERSFKGFDEPQPVFLLLGKREGLSLTEERPFFGREEELSALREALQPLAAGRFAGTVAVIGEAGIGKSRLVQAFLEPLAAAGTASLFYCQTDEILRQSLNPFRAFLHTYFDQSATRAEAANRERFEARIDTLLQHIDEPLLHEQIQRTWSFLGNLVGLRWPDSLYEQLDPELRFENTLEGLKALFKAESLRRPVIIQIEDAHWLDQDSLAFLTRLTRNVEEYPLAILLTSRSPLPDGIFAENAPQHELLLQALPTASVAGLAECILERRPSPGLTQLLAERTEGNPFFVEQMLLYLQENGLLEKVETNAGRAFESRLYIPTDVRAVLTARLDRLPAQVKDVVQKAAVLGREFETPILAQMLDHDPQLQPSLDTAATESVWDAVDEVRYLFRHALLRDAAYDMQLQARRRQLHQLAAIAFETEQQRGHARRPRYATIAYHYDRAELAEAARHNYRLAGERAQDEYRNEDGISYYGRALELTPEQDREAQIALLNGREKIYHWLGRREEQRRDLAKLATLLAGHKDERRLSDLALRQASFAVVTGDYETALQKAEAALVHALRSEDARAEAEAYQRWGRTLWQRGAAQEAKEKLAHALPLAESLGERALAAECLSDLATAHRLLNDYAIAQRYLEKAMINYQAVDDEQGQVRCYNLFGVIEYDLGHFAESEQYYLRALALCHDIGWRYAEGRVLTNLGNTQFDLGDYGKSRGYLEQASALTQETGETYLYANSLDTLGMVAHYSGQLEEAISFYREALELQRAIGNSREMGFVLTHLGHALLESGDLAGAEANLREALALREEMGATALRLDSLAGLAALALARGELGEAREITAVILAHLDEHGSEGIELPVLVYLNCYHVLDAAGEKREARRILETGYTLLANRERRLHDADMRRRFLEEVPFNRDLRAIWLSSA